MDAVTAAARRFSTCRNAGDELALLALLTDEAAGQTVAGGVGVAAEQSAGTGRAMPPAGLIGEYVASPENPAPRLVEEGLRVALLDIRDVAVLADGRFAAVTEIGPPPAASRSRRTEERFEVVARDGRYLIDDPDESAATGTPIP